jgi:DNA-binding MarR family transcriptional regulator
VSDSGVRWLDDEQQRTWRGLVMGMTLLMDRLDDDLERTFGISMTEYEILVRLSEKEGRRMRMAQLADAMAHSRSRVTHTVRRLQEIGLVERRKSPDDGRGVECRMTDQGWELLVRMAPCHVAGVRENLVDLVSCDDFEAIGRVMNTVADHLVAAHPEMELR